jgi:phospholipid-translocating ATPase
MIVAAFVLVVLCGAGFAADSFVLWTRYMLLLSSIIPISMRVNLELAKFYYCVQINKDEDIPGSIGRNSQIPEELGRI